MTTEQLIKRYQQRSGFHLADYSEVALPIYTLNVQALTLAHKRLPPTEEFILRCLAMNLNVVGQMSNYLGLEEEIIKGALANLYQTENVALTAERGIQSWVLTTKGRATLETAELVSPEERTISIHFDAITRKPTLYRFQKPLKHSQLADETLIEIEQVPPRQPQQSEISAFEIEHLLKSIPGLAEQRRDVLAIRSLENIKKAYIRAIALIFKSTEGNDVQVAFVIDGKMSSEHEIAFARSKGFERLTFSFSMDPEERKEIQEAATAIHGKVRLQRSPKVENMAAAAEVVVAEAEHALLTATPSNPEKKELEKRLKTAEQELERLRAEAKQLEVRNLYVLDHPPLLEDALLTAKDRILIISPWIRAKVVNHEFLKKLEQCLINGIKIYIGYGIADESTSKLPGIDIKAIENLRSLAQKFPKFYFRKLGNTHAKVLIKDMDFAAISSFNWLSFKGDPNRTFRDEQGTLLQRPELVQRKFAELVSRFE